MQKRVIDLNNQEARTFFLKQESYCSTRMPGYVNFQPLLDATAKILETSQLEIKNSQQYENVNYKLINNKDGKYAWRPLQLIHPAIYVDLVNSLTKEKYWKSIVSQFERWSKIDRISCASIPVKSSEYSCQLMSNFEDKIISGEIGFFKDKNGNIWGKIKSKSPLLIPKEEEIYLILEEKFKNKNGTFLDTETERILKFTSLSGYIQLSSKQSDNAATISNWYEHIEQQSMILALDFEYLLHLDITDCYGSIYSHSIAWALHGKDEMKEALCAKNKRQNLIGDIIDRYIRNMSHGQTNGIPQGSVLMDFIAEIVLGYADDELSKKLKLKNITEYKILRYRDDYRVFTNNPKTADVIAKLLTETLIDLGLKLNSNKTLASDNIIKDSIKIDKRYWLERTRHYIWQNELMSMYNFAEQFPNAGSLAKPLMDFVDKLSKANKFNKRNGNLESMISIITNMMLKNPRFYPDATAILSKFLSFIENDEDKKSILNRIIKKIESIPNTEYLEIWMQRLTLKMNFRADYNSDFCKKIYEDINGNSICLWNCDCIKNKDLKSYITSANIVDKNFIDNMNPVISRKEIEVFSTHTS